MSEPLICSCLECLTWAGIEPPHPPPARPPAKLCHYCGAEAKTRDHVVPQSLLLVQQRNMRDNIVPACNECNRRKAHYRSNCECMTCQVAWVKYGPPGWTDILVVELVGESGR